MRHPISAWVGFRVALATAFVAALILAAFLVASLGAAKRYTFPPVGRATGVEIRATRDNSLVRALDDQARVAAIVAFVDARRAGWEIPIGGVPVPQFAAAFEDGAVKRGRFGVGCGFFETWGPYGFASRRAGVAEIEEFLRLIDVTAGQLSQECLRAGVTWP
jgi:hypothetical protein